MTYTVAVQFKSGRILTKEFMSEEVSRYYFQLAQNIETAVSAVRHPGDTKSHDLLWERG